MLRKDGHAGDGRAKRRSSKADDGILAARSDLDAVILAHSRLCDQMKVVVTELEAALRAVSELERAERQAPDVVRVSRAIKDIIRASESVSVQVSGSLGRIGEKESGLLRLHESACRRMDRAVLEARKALAVASVVDRAAGTGFNAEARMSRRLGVRSIQKVLQAVRGEVSRMVGMARGRAGAHSRAVGDLIGNVPGSE